MNDSRHLSRRKFLTTAALGALAAGLEAESTNSPAGGESGEQQRIPLKIGLRTATMNMVGSPDVFQVGRRIPGITGIELQADSNALDLWDMEKAKRYKEEAHRWGMIIPSFNLVWRGKSTIRDPAAGADLLQAVRVSEFFGASVILIAYFRDVLLNLNDESAYGPLVELFQKIASSAKDAGITLGMENALTAAENVKLLALVDRPNVKIYYDAFTIANQGGHPEDAISGISVLGKERICQVHMHSSRGLLVDQHLVDHAAALQALNAIGYEGWFFFETKHKSQLELIEDTGKNIEFVRQHSRMPFA